MRASRALPNRSTRLLALVPAIAMGLSPAAATAQPEKSEGGSIWSEYWEDQGVGKAIDVIKDSRGNVYQVAPAGPRLKFGVSTEALRAQGARHGYQVLRAGKAPELVLSAPPAAVKERVAAVMRAERGAQRMGAAWEIYKLGDAIYTAYQGEGSVSEAQHELVASTVATELGLGVTAVAGQMGTAATLGVGAVTAWSADQVKTAIQEGLSAWEAAEQAKRADDAWKANDVRLAEEKLLALRGALQRGDYGRARSLNTELNAFTESRRQLGGPRITALNGLTFQLQDAIGKAERAKAAALAQASRTSQAEWRQRLDAWRAKVQAKRERERAERAEFDVRLFLLEAQVAPGAQVGAGILLTGGAQPFTLSGHFSGPLPSRVARFQFRAPTEPGVYGLEVTARDALDRVRTTSAVLVVEGERRVAGLPQAGGPIDERLSLGGCDVAFRVDGVLSDKVEAFDDGPNRRQLRISGPLLGATARLVGSARAPGSTESNFEASVSAHVSSAHHAPMGDKSFRRLDKEKRGASGEFDLALDGLTRYEFFVSAYGEHCALSVLGRFWRPGKKRSITTELEEVGEVSGSNRR